MDEFEGVVFTVKELFLDIKQEVHSLRDRVDKNLEMHRTRVDELDRKASRIIEVSASVSEIQEKVLNLEMNAVSREAIEKNERQIRFVIFTSTLAVIGWIVSIAVEILRKP